MIGTIFHVVKYRNSRRSEFSFLFMPESKFNLPPRGRHQTAIMMVAGSHLSAIGFFFKPNISAFDLFCTHFTARGFVSLKQKKYA